MWETKDVLLILGVISGAVTTIAVVRTQVASILTRLQATEETGRRHGERIGKVETILTVNAAVAKHLRTPAFGIPIPQEFRGNKRSDDTGGSDE